MAQRKKIAAIITEYRVPAHADVIVGKFIKGFPTDEGMQEAAGGYRLHVPGPDTRQ